MAATGWRLRVVHKTGYRYAGNVASSYNEVRLTPLSGVRQTVLDARVDVSPNARLMRYQDYWSTIVHAFDLHQPHDELLVTGTCVVETTPAVEAGEGVSWDEIASAADDLYCELVLPSRYVPNDPALASEAVALRVGASTPRHALDAAVGWVRDQLTYDRESTSVSTTGTEAWGRGGGVCQDFAHLTLGVLRAMGIPARYVSGYLHPSTDAEISETVQGESHAWVEAWIGAWAPVDPTGTRPVGTGHITVAKGRDYGDVPPLKGVFTGASSSAPVVTVELTRTK